MYRQILECEIWDNDTPYDERSAWVELLLKANHHDKQLVFNGKVITIKRGELVTSIRKLALQWNWGRDRVSRFLDRLAKFQMIEKESDTNRTLITIVNYEVYQGEMDNESDTHEDTNKDTHKDTHKAQTRNKEVKNKRILNIYGEFSHVKLTQEEYDRLGTEFGETKRALMIKKLDEYIEQKPSYKNKNHNLAIRNWVVKAVEEDTPKPKPNDFKNNYMKHNYDYDAMEKELLARD